MQVLRTLELTEEARRLVELRLDLIDKVLLGTAVGRKARLALVADYEAELLDRLARHSPDVIEAADVFAVLNEWGPPEAITTRVVVPAPITEDAGGRQVMPPLCPLAVIAGASVAIVSLVSALVTPLCLVLEDLSPFVAVSILQPLAIAGELLGAVSLWRMHQQKTARRGRLLALVAVISLPFSVVFCLLTLAVGLEANWLDEWFVAIAAVFPGGALVHGVWMAGHTIAVLRERPRLRER